MTRWLAAVLLGLVVVSCMPGTTPAGTGAPGSDEPAASAGPSLPLPPSNEPGRASPSLEVPPPIN